MTRVKLPLIVFVIGTAVAVIVAAISLVFFNPPQCPSYTSSEGANCVIGANIGLGLYLFLAIGVWIVGNLVALILAVRNIALSHARSKRVRLIHSILVAVGAYAVTYAVVWLFLANVNHLIRS